MSYDDQIVYAWLYNQDYKRGVDQNELTDNDLEKVESYVRPFLENYGDLISDLAEAIVSQDPNRWLEMKQQLDQEILDLGCEIEEADLEPQNPLEEPNLATLQLEDSNWVMKVDGELRKSLARTSEYFGGVLHELAALFMIQAMIADGTFDGSEDAATLKHGLRLEGSRHGLAHIIDAIYLKLLDKPANTK